MKLWRNPFKAIGNAASKAKSVFRRGPKPQGPGPVPPATAPPAPPAPPTGPPSGGGGGGGGGEQPPAEGGGEEPEEGEEPEGQEQEEEAPPPPQRIYPSSLHVAIPGVWQVSTTRWPGTIRGTLYGSDVKTFLDAMDRDDHVTAILTVARAYAEGNGFDEHLNVEASSWTEIVFDDPGWEEPDE